MAVVRIPSSIRIVALIVGTIAFPFGAGDVRGDRIVLRGGGQIRGKVIPDRAHPGRVTVLTESGKTPLSFQKPQILEVVAEPSALDEYVVKREKTAATAKEQYELGLWCEGHKLPDLAVLHYEAAVKQDKAFGPAHQKLGHALQGDRWITGDELREAQGLVRYKGKWITKEERDSREAKVAFTAEQNAWARRIRILRQAIVAGPIDRSRQAEQQLMEIREPIAVNPLLRVLGQDIDPLRILLDHVLGRIPGPEAAAALVGRILYESEPEVREVTLSELERRKEANVIPTLLKALTSTEPQIVNRAAWTLSNLDAIAVVPRLIPALITTQYRVVEVPSSNGTSGGGFSSITPPALGGSPIAYNGSSIAYLTGPAVGNGSIAFGLSGVPYGNISGSSLSLGGTGAPTSRGPEPKLLAYSYQNVEVLAALVHLTGQDFGYDIATWKRWVATSFQREVAPARRVPQP